jgi:hypothetical protein
LEGRKKSWNGFQREAYDSIHSGLEKALKSRSEPWTVEELSHLPLGSKKLRSVRGDRRSRQAIYEHLRHFEGERQIRWVGRGAVTWAWENEDDIPKSKIRELPEIIELKEACTHGDFLYNYNRRMFSEPEKDEFILSLIGPVPPREKRRLEMHGREIGCMYIHTDIQDNRKVWHFVNTWRDRFLYEEPYFLSDVLEWLLDNRGLITDLGIDIEFLTGKKSLQELPTQKVEDLRKALLGSSRTLQVVFSVNFNALFRWLGTPAGRDLMSRVLSMPRLRKKAEEISSDWAAGERFFSRQRRD